MDEMNRKLDADLWRRRQQQREQEREQQKQAEQVRQTLQKQREAERSRSWTDWFNEQANEFIAEYNDQIVTPAHNELVGDVEKGFDAVYKEIDGLRDEVKTLRAELTATRAIVNGDVRVIKAKNVA
jgi:hypothetical protein